MAAETRHSTCQIGGGGSDMKSHYLSKKIGRILAALFFLVSIGIVSSTSVQAQWPYPQDRDRDYRRDRDQDRDRDYRRDRDPDRDRDRYQDQQAYREGFLQGYNQGYQRYRGSRNRRNGNNGRWPFPW